MKLFKKISDERQELEMLKIERVGFWTLFWGLAVVMQIQLFTSGNPELLLRQIAGEGAVLLIGALVVTIGCIRKGLWSNRFKPDPKTNVLFSLAGALIFSILMTARNRYLMWENAYDIRTNLMVFLFSFVFLFLACFVLLTVSAAITKWRKAKLDASFDDNDPE
jgi:uncharacterized membrane protein